MSRRQLLEEHFNNIKKVYVGDDSFIKDLQLDDEAIYFHYNDGNYKEAFTLQVADYPDHSLLFFENGDLKSVTGSLTDILKKLIITRKKKDKKGSDDGDGDDDDDSGAYDSISDEDTGVDESLEQLGLVSEKYSSDTDLSYSGGSWRGQSSGYWKEDEYIEENRYLDNRTLMQDVHNFETLFGAKSIDLCPISTLEQVDIHLHFDPSSVLSPQMCTAWGINPRLAITVKLSVSDIYYMDATKPPDVDVMQIVPANAHERGGDVNVGSIGRKGKGGKGKDGESGGIGNTKFTAGAQLLSILKAFVSYHWPSKSGKTWNEVENLQSSGFIPRDATTHSHTQTHTSTFVSSVKCKGDISGSDSSSEGKDKSKDKVKGKEKEGQDKSKDKVKGKDKDKGISKEKKTRRSSESYLSRLLTVLSPSSRTSNTTDTTTTATTIAHTTTGAVTATSSGTTTSNKRSSALSLAALADTSVKLEEVVMLTQMGFAENMACNALKMTDTIEEAASWLAAHPEQCTDEAFAKLKGQQQQKQDAGEGETKTPGVSDVRNLFKDDRKSISAFSQDRRMAASPRFGFLVMVGAYLHRRLHNLNDYCVICDGPHVFSTGNMLKPAVCSRDLCVWSFQQLGVGADAADDIATEAEVVDLLICMATAAVASARKDTIFDPYPQVFDPANPKTLALDPNKKDFQLVLKILGIMPSVESMTQADDFVSMKDTMDRGHALCYPLFQWIITSNRSHIVQLPAGQGLPSMDTPHQYLLLSAPPEKEEKFRQYKKQHGSVFAFHGSSVENWHSILRKGLVNASGTKLQVNGAAYGKGIYLSPLAATSFGYSRIYNTPTPGKNTPKKALSGNRFLDSSTVGCIAICEVINHKIAKNNSIWVQPETDYVVTRLFCVYPNKGNTAKATACDTGKPGFQKEILDVLERFGR